MATSTSRSRSTRNKSTKSRPPTRDNLAIDMGGKIPEFNFYFSPDDLLWQDIRPVSSYDVGFHSPYEDEQPECDDRVSKSNKRSSASKTIQKQPDTSKPPKKAMDRPVKPRETYRIPIDRSHRTELPEPPESLEIPVTLETVEPPKIPEESHIELEEQRFQAPADSGIGLVPLTNAVDDDVLMDEVPMVKDMDEAEARKSIANIKARTASLMELCYLFESRKGYEALGYASFKECIANELTDVISYNYAHKLKIAGEVHMIVSPDTPVGSINESILRELAKVPENDKKKEVWEYLKNEYPDIKEVTATTTGKAIDFMGIERASARRGKTTKSKDTIDQKLVEKLHKNVFEIIKKHGYRPETRENYEKDLKNLFDSLHNSLATQFEPLSGTTQMNLNSTG